MKRTGLIIIRRVSSDTIILQAKCIIFRKFSRFEQVWCVKKRKRCPKKGKKTHKITEKKNKRSRMFFVYFRDDFSPVAACLRIF